MTEIGGNVTTASKTVVNIETATLRTDTGSVTANTIGWTGLTTLNVTSAGADVNLDVADTTAVNLSNVTGGNIAIDGGSTITVTSVDNSAGNETVTVNGGDATTAVTLTDVDSGNGQITVADLGTNNNTITAVTLDGVDSGATAIDVIGEAITSLTLADVASQVDFDNDNVNGFALSLSVDNLAGGLVIDEVNGNATSVAITVVTDSSINLDAAGATSITVAGAEVLTLDDNGGAGLDAVESITVSGAAGVSGDLSTLAALTTFNASATSGNNTVTFDNIAGLTVQGGTGADDVTTVGAIAADTEITLGAGDDSYTFDAAATAGATVDAGAGGTDTLATANGAFLDAADVYTNFEVLEIGGGQGNYDMDFLSGVTAAKVSETTLLGNVAVLDAAAGTTLEFVSAASTDFDVTDDTAGNDYTIDYALKTNTGTADSLTITLTAVDGDDDGNAEGSVTINGTLTADDIETFTIVAQATTLDEDVAATTGADESSVQGDYTHTITDLAAADVKTINVQGASNLTVTDVAAANLSKIDASQATGDVEFTNAVTGATKAITFLGGSGDDTYTASAIAGDLIQGNGGADTFTQVAGKQTFRYAADTDSVLTLTDADGAGAATAASGYDVINGVFQSGTDKIELSSALGLATGDARSAITGKGTIGDGGIADNAELASDIDALIGDGVNFFNDGTTDRATAQAIVNDGTDFTLLFVDVNADGDFTAGTDNMIQLTGVTAGLDVSDIVFG